MKEMGILRLPFLLFGDESMKKLVIFDMDGLLIDTEKIYLQGWKYGLDKNNLEISTEILESWRGQGVANSMNILRQYIKDEDIIKQIAIEREKYILLKLEQGNITLKPYAMEVINTLRRHGIRIALASSSNHKRAEKLLTYFNLFSKFNFLTFGDEVKETKPNPEIYLKSMEKAGVSAIETIAVEDSITGGLSASNAGCEVILVPDQSFTSLPDFDQEARLNIVAKSETLKIVLDYLKLRL